MGETVAAGAVVAWCVALSVSDVRHRRLPNVLTLPGALVMLLGAAAVGRGLPAVAGAGVLFAVYAAVHLVSPSAMGAGDVKLAIGLGALTGGFGSQIWLPAALGAPLLSGVWAVAILALRSKQTVPHGLSMCVASMAAVAPAVL
ncbi:MULTISPECIES: A24 family peptidase [Mycobacteriaceae]|uniref:prepilin peptidase n=1 Tax=Mycobacteriaceae TaxID=1762 RepID=UPI000800B20E|nr:MULTISPECIES: A24 family peptidase [Mycobacteriaceae]MCK0175314.1 A24 family peptidase [Mycolicibacterium sp. F2034L]OBB59833.1 peptidase A24 [Mycobacterium sp. 852013-51886_SCH5428379]